MTIVCLVYGAFRSANASKSLDTTNEKALSLPKKQYVGRKVESMFCSNCGKKLDEKAKFCSGCGTPVGELRETRSQTEVFQQSIAEPQHPPKDKLMTVDSGNGKRSEVYLTCEKSPSEAAQIAEQILAQSGFNPKEYKGEAVWKKGTGMATAMQFVKIAPFEDALGIQAWVQAGIGDVGLKEQSLDGFVGALPKKMLLKVIEQIQKAI